MLTLNLIGCGRLGRTLAHLWARTQHFHIGDILTRSPDSAAQAVAFIGAGQPLEALSAMHPADLWLLATPDDQLADSARQLEACGYLRRNDIVFHCSGALPADILRPLTGTGAHIASVHPVKSFAAPETAVTSFPGTWCGMEGEKPAVDLLRPAFEAIGGRVFMLDPAGKTLYHSANVMVCNNLVALLEAGLQLFEQAGVPREMALQITEPIVRGTLDNVFGMGTKAALTGPIARGDYATVAHQLEVLEDSEHIEIYRLLGRICVTLAADKGSADSADLDRIAQLLQSANGD